METAVGAGGWQDDPARVVGDVLAAGVFVVGEVQGADGGAQLHHGGVGRAGEGGDERDRGGEVAAEGVACGEHEAVRR